MLAKRILVPSLERPSIFLVVSVVLLIACLRSAAAAEGWLAREQSGTLQYRLPESADWSPPRLAANCSPARPCAPAAVGLPSSPRPRAAS